MTSLATVMNKMQLQKNPHMIPFQYKPEPIFTNTQIERPPKLEIQSKLLSNLFPTGKKCQQKLKRKFCLKTPKYQMEHFIIKENYS